MSNVVTGPKGGLLQTTALAGAAVIKDRFVKRGADADHVIQGTAASINLGIASDNQDTAERPVPFTHRGGELVQCEAGAAFSLDALLTSDSVGRAVPATTAQAVGAIAREAATAAGQLCVVEIVGGRLVAP